MSEEIGEALREAFEAKLEALGQPFILHSNINTLDASQIEVNGLIKSEGRNTGRMVFQFLDPIDVKAGSILQIKGGRDFWKVIDTEDVVEHGVLVKFEVD